MSRIKSIRGREVLDSRGNPTVEAEVITNDGNFIAKVPSGASTGKHEAVELRDGGKRYSGKGVLKAVNNIKKIEKVLKGKDVSNQAKLDQIMIDLDGTENKAKLGANAILAVSMAVARAGANKTPLYKYIAKLSGRKGKKIPVPQMNVINGGKHAGMENDPQEHMFVPVNAKSFSEALRLGTETYHVLKGILKKKYGALATLVGDEGGFVPPIKDFRKRLEIMVQAISKAGYSGKIKIALDPASSEFYKKGKYWIGKKSYSSGEMVDFYSELIKTYPIISIEDGLAEDDWDGWTEMTKKLGKKIQITGDDFLVTNVWRVREAIASKSANSLLLKVNQIGTITEAIKAAKLSFKHKWGVTVSHRSGETEDCFIADLAVGLNATQIKAGAPARSERMVKYNRLLKIEEELGSKAEF